MCDIQRSIWGTSVSRNTGTRNCWLQKCMDRTITSQIGEVYWNNITHILLPSQHMTRIINMPLFKRCPQNGGNFYVPVEVAHSTLESDPSLLDHDAVGSWPNQKPVDIAEGSMPPS